MIPLASALLELLFLSLSASLFISDWGWLAGKSSGIQRIVLSCVTICFILSAITYVIHQGFQMDWWRYFSIIAAIGVGGFLVMRKVGSTLERKDKYTTSITQRSVATGSIAGVVAFLLITYANGALFALSASLVKDLIDITLNLLGLGAILFAALELLEHSFVEVSKKHKQIADKIVSDIVDTPVFEKMPSLQEAVAELRRLNGSARKIVQSYSTLKRILGVGFIYILGIDLILEIVHLILFRNLSMIYKFSLGNLLFSFEAAVVILALLNLLVGVHLSIAKN